jgi:DNA-binding transcriptional MerR regulator
VTELLDIGEVVARSGIPVSTLHVWERRGLISPAGRVGLRRQYLPEVLGKLAVIVVCQRAGFSLQEVRSVLAPEAFDEGKGLLQDKLEQLLERRRQLDQAIDGLRHALDCTEPSPLGCRNFLAELDGVLPLRP